MNRAPDLLVVGASARAASLSSLRAGRQPLACDIFADLDLRRACEWIRVPRRDYPRRIPALLRDVPALPLIYTGGLENHPRVVARLARRHRLLGNDSHTLREARAPLRLHEALARHGLSSPDCLRGLDPPRSPAGWLSKPLRGSGGAGIRPAMPGERSSRIYFQRFVEGAPLSAVFVAGGRETLLLGVTRQLVGEAWLAAPPFSYSGSIGPLSLSSSLHRKIERSGEVVAASFGLRGLFGLDLVLEDPPGTGRAWVIELNPRYTASVEVLEEALDVAALELHIRACDGGSLPRLRRPSRTTVSGKAVVYADREIRIRGAREGPAALPGRLADIPAPGEVIPPGHPAATVLVRAGEPEACLTALREAAREARRWLVSA